MLSPRDKYMPVAESGRDFDTTTSPAEGKIRDQHDCERAEADSKHRLLFNGFLRVHYYWRKTDAAGPGYCHTRFRLHRLRRCFACPVAGAKVLMVEKSILGGTCVNWGCIPAKR